MSEFVSEALTPLAGVFDAGAMAAGEPGLPAGFRWRGVEVRVSSVIERWKFTSAEGGHAQGDVYLRRHYWRLKMSNGATWTVYFTRQAPRSGAARRRWFLFEVE